MLKYASCHEKLWKTVRLLSILDMKLKKRLIAAYEDQLHYIDPNTLPPHLIEDLIKINNQLTKNHTKPIKETIHKWKISKVMSVVDNIFFLNERLNYHINSMGKT